MGDLYINIVRQSEENGNNILHLAGRLAPSHRLRIVSGAALQMQRELQWFKEIENLVQPSYKSKRNKYGQTPQEIFSESHHHLMMEGEKWMKDTANSCTVAAALIATIVFAAAITVPGGNNGESGRPMLASEKAFIIFGVADALSLFSSSISILMFLSILTSRYAEGDFLRALPKRLIIGLLTLFLSIATMMVAFSSTLYLTFGNQKRWILSSVLASSCLPVAIFASMHFSLLAEMISSTYGSGIFKKRSKKKGKKPFKRILN
uniref:PGG domain-containing protein n=1 Tax=Kalanchoe fedtschenkoi TaxID=63787 RepID=A0A7N0TYS2_KALFE